MRNNQIHLVYLLIITAMTSFMISEFRFFGEHYDSLLDRLQFIEKMNRIGICKLPERS